MKKKYVTIISSLIFALCMIVTVALTTIGTEATNAGVEYIPNVVYTEDNTAPTTPEGYSDVLFAGWYENTGTEENPVYSPVKEPVINQSYYAKFVPKEVLSVQAQISGNIFEKDEVSDATKNKIRFVTTIDDSLYYKKVGFIINVGGYWEQEVEVDEWVYQKIYAVGATEATDEVYYPNMISDASAYFKTYTFTNIPEEYLNTDITVTPYWDTLDGTRVCGTTSTKTVNMGRSWFYVDNAEDVVRNENAPIGAYSNPYADLQAAVKAEGNKRAPKVILKSDYELSSGVTVEQTLTLASENSKSISRVSTWTSGRMLTVNAEGKTVTLEDITINGKELGACVQLDAGTLHMLDGSTITNGQSNVGANIDVKANSTLVMEDGSEISNGMTTQHGGNILLRGSGTLTMNGGTISGGKAISDSENANYGCGGNIHIYSNAKFTINGGEILNGLAQNSANVANVAKGGNICSTSTINMYGGKISGGIAESTYTSTTTETTVEDTKTVRGCGGNIFAGNLNIHGGEISNGTAKSNNLTMYTGCGGNIYSTGTVKIDGEDALITEGTAEILFSSTTEIKTHTFAGCGGNIFSNKVVEISNGMISSGTAYTKCKTYSTGCGGNIYSQAEVTIEGTDTIIKDGTAKATTASNNNLGFGGNICMYGTSATSVAELSITDSTISGGKAAGRGGNIQAFQHADITLTGATVSGGSIRNASGNEVSGNGGNIFISKASLTLNGGTKIEKGVVKGNGGNIAFNASDANYKLTINSGVTITEGTATNGGNLSLQGTKGKVDLNGGCIMNGTATTLGDNIYFHEKTPVYLGSDVITVSNVEAKSGVAYTFNILGNLHSDTRISVTLEAGTGVFAKYEDATNYKETDLACFASDNDAYVVSYAEGEYSLVSSEATE